MDLTDQQWTAVEKLLPKPKVRDDGRGRPWRDPRDVLNGILWVLRTGAPWADMPRRYPPYSTCFRRFQAWVKSGVLKRVLQELADDLVRRGKLDLSEAFIDGSHAGAKRGVFLWEERECLNFRVRPGGFPEQGDRYANTGTSMRRIPDGQVAESEEPPGRAAG